MLTKNSNVKVAVQETLRPNESVYESADGIVKPDHDVSKIPITTPSNQVETTTDLEGPKEKLYEADKSNNNETAANGVPSKERNNSPRIVDLRRINNL